MSLDEHLPPPADQQGYLPAAPAQRGTSGLAIAGLILAFLIAPLGLILSLVAVLKTGRNRAKGRGLAITGIIVSLLIIAGATTAVYKLANSTLADPGCTAGKTAIINAAAGSTPDSLQAAVDALNAAAAKAKHDMVRVATKALADDYAQLVNAMKTGEMPPGIQEKISTDAAAFDSVCSIGG